MHYIHWSTILKIASGEKEDSGPNAWEPKESSIKTGKDRINIYLSSFKY